MTNTARGTPLEVGRCTKCSRDIEREPGAVWRHQHNNTSRCAPGTRNACLASPAPHSVRTR